MSIDIEMAFDETCRRSREVEERLKKLLQKGER
jgi:hypothetical protein